MRHVKVFFITERQMDALLSAADGARKLRDQALDHYEEHGDKVAFERRYNNAVRGISDVQERMVDELRWIRENAAISVGVDPA